MSLLFVAAALGYVIWLYFQRNPMKHSRKFMVRRLYNWLPLGMTYAFLYMARYNLNVVKNALGEHMSVQDFGTIFAAGTVTYGCSFLLTGPFVDKIGGKKGMLIASLGSCLANLAMGLVTYLMLKGQLTSHILLTFSILYSINMFFQSYGAVSIIKVKAYWFHVRERGVFGAIFGTLISFGVYFAFDWGQAVADASTLHNTKELSWFQQAIRWAFAVETGTTNATWLVFVIPSIILIFWALVNAIAIKDTPSQANFEDFDTHDASSGEMERDFTVLELLKRIFTSPVLLTIAMIEFVAGVIRNGILQWYPIFAKQIPQVGAEFVAAHWGLWLCIAGICGGFLAGWISDHFFHSRRGPAAGILNAATFVFVGIMAIFLSSAPLVVGFAAVMVALTGIGTHAIMSGTAASDFGGRKATATASGITDGFVYLGTGLQSYGISRIVTNGWEMWPVFLLPFALVGVYLAVRIWKALPEATKRYLITVEKVNISIIETVESRQVEVINGEV